MIDTNENENNECQVLESQKQKLQLLEYINGCFETKFHKLDRNNKILDLSDKNIIEYNIKRGQRLIFNIM